MHARHPKSDLATTTLVFAATVLALAAARPAPTASDGDGVAMLIAWVVAVAASTWLTVSSVACFAAALRRSAAPRFAPRVLRRLVEIAVVTTAVALPALPAHAAGPVSPPRDQPVVRAPDAGVPVPPTTGPPTTLAPATVPATVAPAPLARPRAARRAPAPNPLAPASMPPGAGTRSHVVQPGDNLWSIARGTLTSAGRSSDTELVAYWHAVIASNRATLRSGNPSLIFPGEIVTLPPLP